MKGKISSFKGCKHTEEAKIKIGIKSKGRKRSKESIEKQISKQLGKKKKPCSLERKLKISKANKKKDIKNKDIIDLLAKGYTQAQIARELNTYPQLIYSRIKNIKRI